MDIYGKWRRNKTWNVWSRSYSVENSESYSSYGKNLSKHFPRLTAVLTIYIALPVRGCEVKRNLWKLSTGERKIWIIPLDFLQKMILQNLYHMKKWSTYTTKKIRKNYYRVVSINN